MFSCILVSNFLSVLWKCEVNGQGKGENLHNKSACSSSFLSASVPNKYRKTIKQHKIFNVTNHKNTFREEMVKIQGK